MCLGIPGEIVSMTERDGVRVGEVRFGAVRREVCLECVPEAVLGDYVLVHVGFAIARLDADEAARTFETLRALAGAEEGLT